MSRAYCQMHLKHCLFCLFLYLPMPLKAQEYAYSSQWLSMMHYQRYWLGYKGTIASSNFYVSEQGRTNPQNELQANIALFNSDDNQRKCQFPARYKLLKQHGFIKKDFPYCSEYEKFKQDLQPAGVTLIFTDAYMNNASSLFGHTLLRIDTRRKGTQLLAHGVNYGAFTQGYENNLLYPLFGLAGFYAAGFTTKPYYEIINTYNNIENRDIWEYNLNLTDKELDMLIAHIWEVGQSSTPYYFFSLNCSYMLMEVLDAVRPELSLAKEFPLHTIPLDTIKQVNKRNDFVKSVNYRPSRQRKIKHRISQMTDLQYQAFLQAVKHNKIMLQELPDDQKADVIETAYQYIQYQYIAKKTDLKEYRQKSFNLLQERRQISEGQKFNNAIKGENPADAHDSALISFGIGQRNGHAFQQLSFKPAYHDLTDRNYGFLPGSAIDFMNVSVRHYDHKDRYVLQNLEILKLSSLSPITDIFKSPSYQIDVNIQRITHFPTDKEGYALKGSVAGGGTLQPMRGLNFYTLGLFETAYGGFLPQNQWQGIGLTGGVLWDSDSFSLQSELKKVWATSKIGANFSWNNNFNYYLTSQIALSLSYKYIYNASYTQDETLISIKKHF